MPYPNLRRRIAPLLRFWISLSAGSATLAASQARNANPIAFDISAAIAAEALKRFSNQSGIEVIIEAELGRTVRTKEVRGEMLPRDAIYRKLAGTGLEVSYQQQFTFLSGLLKRPEHIRQPHPALTMGVNGRF